MGTIRLFVRSVPALVLVMIWLSGGWDIPTCGAASESSFGDANTPAAPAFGPTAAAEPQLKRASHVLHARVKSTDGKTVGRVHDLVLTPDLGGISYVAVSSGGVLGVGGTMHAVPWSALQAGADKTYAVAVSQQQFKEMGAFRGNAWPNSAEPGWAAAGPESTYRGRTAGTVENVQDRRFTRIRGSEARTSQSRNAGDVRDLMIVMESGQIAYTILSHGGMLGFGSRYVAVPERAVTLEPATRVARIDVPLATLQANSFASHQWPDLASASYARQLDQAFGVQSAETALGYVPPEGTAVAAAPTPRTPRAPAPRSTTRSTTPAPPTPDELTGTFNASSITALDGTVVGEGKFRAAATGPDMLWLRVRTADGRTVLVNLGPRNYVSAQDFYIVRGDRVHLSGSEVPATASGRRVFLATDVTYDSHVLHLRSTNGTPLWEGPTGAATSTSTTGSTSSTAPGTSSTPRTGARTRTAPEPNEPKP